MGKTAGKVKLRRKKVRRQRSAQTAPLFKRLRERVGLASPAIALGFVVLATFIVLYGAERFPYYAGQEVREPIYARVKFKITDEKETRLAQEKGREETPNYYDLNEGLIERIRGAISNLYVDAQQYETYDAYRQSKAEAGEGTGDAVALKLNQRAFDSLRALMDEKGQAQFTSWVDRLAEALKRERLVLIGGEQARDIPVLSNMAILNGALPEGSEKTLEGSDDVEADKLTLHYFGDSNLKEVERTATAMCQLYPPALRGTVRSILVEALSEEPLFRFNIERTRKAMDAEAAARPEVYTDYPRYAVLAKPGQQDFTGADLGDVGDNSLPEVLFTLNSAQVNRLRYEYERIAELLSGSADGGNLDKEHQAVSASLRQQHRLQQAGRGALVFFVTLGLITYCGLFQERVIHNPVRALSIAALFLVMTAVARALSFSEIGVMYPFIVVGPVVMTAAILTMVYSQRFAIGMTAGLTILVTLAVRGDLGMLLVLTGSMAVAVYQLREIRSRHEIFSTGLLNALAASVVTLIVVIVDGYSLEAAVSQSVAAAIAALLAISIFFLMLPPIERIFKVATNWTLLELLDTSRPLLSRLAREAPGTFAHSLWLSSMAEGACEAVGANALLAKVGAMYHDIGKVHKAEYFAENQEAHINRHDNLSPTMSLLIIVGHVKDGVELAREERLPSAVIRFIREHHGTTLVRYFHHVASEQQKAAGNAREISESEFRYPGPKPQSQETAVLMLCDGVEGAVRALQEPTAGRIENVVHNVVMERLNDGQFDDCDITLKELHKIEESLVKSLCRFYHGRVAYPKAPEAKKPAESVPVMG